MAALRSAFLAALGLLAASAMAQALAWDSATWLVEDIGGRGVIDNAQTTLRIEPDGKVSGSTGCNQFFGKAKLEGAALRFGDIATTFRACPPVIADQERKFLHALRGARGARFDRFGRLQIVSGRGAALLTLTKM